MSDTTSKNSELRCGAVNLLVSYLQLKSGDSMIAIADKGVWKSASYLCEVAAQLGIDGTLQPSNQSFHDLTPYFGIADVIVFLGTAESVYSREVVEFLREQSVKARFYRVFDYSDHLLRIAFGTAPADVKRLHDRLIASIIDAGELHVTSPSGTDLLIHFPPGFTWVSTFGHFDHKFPGVLPPSEVATYSPAVNGIFVGDGAINTNFDFYRDPRLSGSPLTFVIRNSVVVDCSCPDPVLLRFFAHLMTLPHANHVGEVGLGTNEGITEFVPYVSHINERAAGFHLGFGGHHQGNKISWHADLHLDVMTNACVMQIGEKEIFSHGKYHESELMQPVTNHEYSLTYIDTV